MVNADRFFFLLKKHSEYVKSWVVYIVLLLRARLEQCKTTILCRPRETGSKILHKSLPSHSRERNFAETWCLFYIALAKAQALYLRAMLYIPCVWGEAKVCGVRGLVHSRHCAPPAWPACISSSGHIPHFLWCQKLWKSALCKSIFSS